MSRKKSLIKTGDSASASSDNRSRQWVMITKESDLLTSQVEEAGPVLCRLRHPKTDSAAIYMFTNGCSKVNEILSFNEGHRSWFINNYVQSDGTMLVSTAVDPLFLALPYLVKASQTGKYSPLDCLLEDGEFPECKKLAGCISADELGNVAEVRGSDDMCAVKYDSEKTLAWLKLKVESLVKALQEHKVNVTCTASVSTFVKSKKNALGVNEDDYIRYACGLIGEYIQPELYSKLREFLGVPQTVASDVKENYSRHSPVKKKSKLDNLTSPLEDYSKGNTEVSKKPEKLSVAQKKLSKVDKTGMKSMSSFFSTAAKK